MPLLYSSFDLTCNESDSTSVKSHSESIALNDPTSMATLLMIRLLVKFPPSARIHQSTSSYSISHLKSSSGKVLMCGQRLAVEVMKMQARCPRCKVFSGMCSMTFTNMLTQWSYVASCVCSMYVVSSLTKELLRYSDITHTDMPLHGSTRTSLPVPEVDASLKTEKKSWTSHLVPKFLRRVCCFLYLYVWY